MAITTAISNQAKLDFLDGTHATGDVYKMLLLKPATTGTWDKTAVQVGTPGTNPPSVTNVGTDEASGTGYTTGGVTLSARSSTLTGDVASIDWGDAVWSSATISASGAVIYNSSKSGKILAVFDFGGTITSTFHRRFATLRNE